VVKLTYAFQWCQTRRWFVCRWFGMDQFEVSKYFAEPSAVAVLTGFSRQNSVGRIQ
jgi:hypothetical protein